MEEAAAREGQKRLDQARLDLKRLRPLVEKQARAAEDAQQTLVAAVDALNSSLEEMQSAVAVVAPWPHLPEPVCRPKDIEQAIVGRRSILDAVQSPRRVSREEELREIAEDRDAERRERERRSTERYWRNLAEKEERAGNVQHAQEIRRTHGLT